MVSRTGVTGSLGTSVVRTQSISAMIKNKSITHRSQDRNLALIPLLYSRSLSHRLGQGSRILSRHEREREGVQDTPSWVTGPCMGAAGGVVAMATVGVEAVRAAARTRSRRPSGRQRH
jgi:hypothetical protein